MTPSAALALLSALSTLAIARAQGQGQVNMFANVGSSGVSAQQLFLGTPTKLYFIDKTENNTLRSPSGRHPAWATEFDLTTMEARAMEVPTNSFCAGGTVLGDGRWLNVGGNQAVINNGAGAGDALKTDADKAAAQAGENEYGDADGRKAVRILSPDDSGAVEWVDDAKNYMSTERWYPTVETVEDGSAIIFGGCQNGGYVNDPSQDNPTYEFFPPKDEPLMSLNILLNTMPLNLFPLVWLLPSGNLLIQAYKQAVIFDYKNKVEYQLPDIPDCARVYPASGATTMLPLTPANNWTAQIIFCGGSNYENGWVPSASLPSFPAADSCYSIAPDVSTEWFDEDSLPDNGRSMGQFINLPDGRIFLVNGAGTGTAGYGNDPKTNQWAVGQSYADEPKLQSWYLDKTQPSGSRWSKAGTSTIPRMYHSSAVLLPDGSVAVSGSNPNADVVLPDRVPSFPNGNYKYYTEYAVEIFYPDYYAKPRPKPVGMPTNLTYGGEYFDIKLSKDDLIKTSNIVNATKAVVIRPGFSTHGMNMGQRHVELRTSFTTHADGGATLHVAQLPPNPAILAPGPALFFVVVDGVPSNASWVTVGDGVIGTQTVREDSVLPNSTIGYDQL